MSEGQVRIFIAIDIPDTAKRDLGRMIGAIDALGVAGVRVVRPDGIHLTLKFLGDVDIAAIDEIVAGIHRAAARSDRFCLALGEIGAFPSRANARVVWVGVDGDVEPLRRLQSNVQEEMRPLGFRRDRRAFNPHLTIARIRDGARPADVRRVLDAASSVRNPPTQIEVGSIHLIRSALHPKGAIYTSLRAEPLRLLTPRG